MIISRLVAISSPNFLALKVVRRHLTNGAIPHVLTNVELIKEKTFLLLPLPRAC